VPNYFWIPQDSSCLLFAGCDLPTHRSVVVVIVEVNLTVVVDIEGVITVCRHIGERSLVESAGRRGQWKSRGKL